MNGGSRLEGAGGKAGGRFRAMTNITPKVSGSSGLRVAGQSELRVSSSIGPRITSDGRLDVASGEFRVAGGRAEESLGAAFSRDLVARDKLGVAGGRLEINRVSLQTDRGRLEMDIVIFEMDRGVLAVDSGRPGVTRG